MHACLHDAWECTHNPHARCPLRSIFEDCFLPDTSFFFTSKTPEGRSAAFRVHGFGFFFFLKKSMIATFFLGRKIDFYTLQNFGWSVSRPIAACVTFDMPECKESFKK